MTMLLLIAAGLTVGHTFVKYLSALRSGHNAALSPNDVTSEPHHTDVSIIIPAWNDVGVLRRTVIALNRELISFAGSYECFIVAGGKDGTFELAKSLRSCLAEPEAWHVLLQQPLGKNAALNQALKLSRHDVLVFLDADTEVQPGWLTNLVGPIVSGHSDATAGCFSAYEKSAISEIFELDQMVTQVVHRSATLFGGGSIAISRRALKQLGNELPEEVVVGVDWDLSERVRALDLNRSFASEAKVRTELPVTWKDYFRNEVRWRRAFFAAELRHLRKDRQARRLINLAYLPTVQMLVLVGWLIFPALAFILGSPAVHGLIIYLIFCGWVVARHCSRCLEAYAYNREHRWLRLLPVYAWSFFLSAAAAWRALFSLGQLTPHFKGRRAPPVS